MKVQIDEKRYLTGSYCTVGGLDNSIEMDSLPNCEPIYYGAYKIIHESIPYMVESEREVKRERSVEIPILDEEGNETGEVGIEVEVYYEMEPYEIRMFRDEYHYELDEKMLSEIKKKIEYLENYVPKPIPTTEEINEKVVNLQQILCGMYETMNL